MIIPALEVVYPPNLNLAPPRWRSQVNLIYVHDIGGSPKTTWHHDESGKTWISDPEFLGSFSNSARAWTYGFNSEPAVNMTPSSIALHANELLSMMLTGYTINGGGGPTIFIAHGLGGIIVKKAILLALSCPEYFGIRETTFGIVFLDTVHHGTDSEGVLMAVKTIAALALQKGSLKPSWEDTRQYSDAVREVNVAFIDRLPPGLEILNFVATRRVELPVEGAEPHKTLVVPKERAELDSPQSKTTKIDCNHFQLTRFPSPSDKIYLQLAEQVADMMGRALADTSKRMFFPPPPAGLRKAPGPMPPLPDPDPPNRPGPPVGRPPMMAPPMRDLSGGAFQIWLRKKNVDYTKERRDRLLNQLGDWSDVHLGHDIHPMPETCKWIESHPYFVQWSKSNATEDFFVYGPAGCGKTHLAKSVVNHLSWDASRPIENIVLHFYCNVSVTGNRRPPIMEHFVKAILRLRPLWFETLGAQSQHPDDEGRPSLAFLFNVLRQLMTKLQPTQGPVKTTTVFLIIDGINECEADFVREFLQLVASLVEHPAARATPPVPPLTTVPPLPPNQVYPRETVRFKFFFTYTPNEVMSLASVRATRIKMKDEDIRKDISTYVDKKVEDLCMVKSTKDPPEEVGSWIKENAGSFFLFANCAMEDGISTAKEHEYGYSMSRRAFPCPRKLGDYYDHDLLPLFQSVDNGNYALPALQVILGTFTPVSGLMIRDALACLYHDPRLKFIDIQTILTHRCARLVKVSDAFEVSPIHPSLGIHFASYISKEEQHANMASLCIQYLSQPVFEGGFGAVERAREHLFYKYAANHWQGHLRFSKDKRTKVLPQLRHFFNSKSYWAWCRYMWDFFDSPKSVISLVIALIPANAADIVHLVDQSIIMDDPETYPWQTGAWGFLWRLKQNAWQRFPEAAQFVDSFRERHYHMAWDPYGLTPLMHAAKDPRGLPDMVYHFLQWPEQINRRDPAIGATAMMFFCRYTESTDEEFIADMIDAFVNAGADVNMSTFLGETCLWLACKSGNLVLVGELLRVKANPNIATVDGSTPIHQALTRWTPKSHKIVQDLVLHGADLNTRFPPPAQQIPLTAAIVDMRFETFLFLLRFVDDVNQIDDGGFAAIHLLIQPKYSDWLSHLLERPDLDLERLTDSKSKTGASIRQTALSFAIAQQSFKAAEMLLQAGARPYRHPSATDRTPLYIAVDFAKTGEDDSSEEKRSSNLDLAKLLLSYNSPINILDPKKKLHSRSPLTRAAEKGNFTMVELLLSHGADPTLEEAYGLPGPLDAAVAEGDIDIVKLLLENSSPPNINYIPADFNHVLVEAAAQSLELVTLLLDRGADTKRFLRPGDARNPLQAAVMENNVPLCKLFIEREPELVNYQNREGLVCETPLIIAAREGNAEIVNCLLDAGADPNLRSFHYNETPLWSACSEGRLDIARLLYEKAPGTINTPSYDGETPLMRACASGSLQLVTFLLEKGADLRPRCSSCASCVAKALSRDGRGAPPYKIIEALVRHGLGVDDVVSSVGHTVLGEACRSGDVPAVRLLLDMGADPVKGQKRPGERASENCWRSALQVAVCHEEVKVLDILLEHPRLADFIGHVDFYGETVLHTNIPSDSASQMATKILDACDKLRREGGLDVFGTMMETENFKMLTPLDLALGGLHKDLSARARAKVDDVIRRYLSELMAAPEITLDEHFHVIRDLSRLLLIRRGYDEEAVRLMQSFVVDAWVREKDKEFEETVFCDYACDQCGKEEDEKLYFCRFCVWNTGQCCSKDYRGVHRLIEVPVVMDRKILNLNSAELIGILGVLEQGFAISETDVAEGELGKSVSDAEADSDETTLSLAYLHALGYLEFRRRAWSPYLPLAPRVYERIEAWDFVMAKERRGFQEWVWRTELQPWRLKSELEYFLECGRRTAYKDVETTRAEEILRDVRRLFQEVRPARAGLRFQKPGEIRRRDRLQVLSGDEEASDSRD